MRVSLSRTVVNLSIPKKLTLIVGLFCVALCAYLPLSYYGMEMLSSNRAYVGGESLWSKAQKEAVLKLGRYAWSHDEREYQSYLKNLEIPLGDRQARLELEKSHPSLSSASTGFLRGGNHPKDIPGMIHLLRDFRHVSYMSRAVEIWRQGDNYIVQLQDLGTQIHREMTSRHSSLRHLEKLLKQVQVIDSKLSPLENAFSAAMGEGARWLKEILFLVMILTTCGFLAATLTIAILISRQLCDEIDQLRTGASRIAHGDYDFTLDLTSQDEIGDLARSFQEMAAQRQHAERLKDEYYASVVAANKELEAFSYSVSHDLRAPLRAIDGFSKELLTNCGSILDERSKEDLTRIRAATQRMGQLIDDLLELSHLSRSELTLEQVDLSTQVGEIMERLTNADPGRVVEHVTAPHVTAEADPRLLKIALENLIQNSLKFTRPCPKPRIEFGVMSQNGHSSYFVRDNGVGFSMAYADKLFKPFQRLHDSKDFPGTGIGLALVQRIIHRHGGKVWAEAEENKGATFYFTLS